MPRKGFDHAARKPQDLLCGRRVEREGELVQVGVIYEQEYLLSRQRPYLKWEPTEGSKLKHTHYKDVAQTWLEGETGLRFESRG